MESFNKILGYKSIKVELERICDILNAPEKYAKLGVSTPHGLMLFGEPGVGKTLMAMCFIEASERKAFICRKDKPNGKFVTEIYKIFSEAVKNAPSIVFLDDVDKFANGDRIHRNAEEFVTIQSCIDDCKDKEVFVIATANELDNLPDSLLRAGRFDKVVKVNSPIGDDAIAIIDYYLSQKKFVADIDTAEVAKILSGGSCAELESVVNEAGVYAGFQGKATIERDDIIRAAMRIVFRAPESLKEQDYNEQLAIAYHEAGHAVIAEVLEPKSVNIVSVLSHDGSIGGVTSYYQSENYFMHMSLMENRVTSLLGGKAATEIVYGEVDTGANNDLHRAFDIVERFIDNYCGQGFLYWDCDTASDMLHERRRLAIGNAMTEYYNKAKKILTLNREFLDKLATALAKEKTLLSKEIGEIKSTCKIIAA